MPPTFGKGIIMSYNGYTNYATWNIDLWLDNDYGMYKAKQSFISGFDGDEIGAQDVAYAAEHILGRTSTPDLEDSDGCRWSDIDWDQLAELWTAEGREQ